MFAALALELGKLCLSSLLCSLGRGSSEETAAATRCGWCWCRCSYDRHGRCDGGALLELGRAFVALELGEGLAGELLELGAVCTLELAGGIAALVELGAFVELLELGRWLELGGGIHCVCAGALVFCVRRRWLSTRTARAVPDWSPCHRCCSAVSA